MLLFCILVLVSVTVCRCANILAIIPMPSYSHQVAYQGLWRELSLRGHKVTVVTTDPVMDKTLTNLTEIDMSYMHAARDEAFNQMKYIEDVKDDPLLFIWNAVFYHKFIVEQELNNPLVQNLIKKKDKQKFDVVLVEAIFSTMFAFAEVYDCPLIAICSLDGISLLYNSIGNPIHPVTHPDFMLQMAPPLNFRERIVSTLSSALLNVLANFIESTNQDLTLKKYFGEKISSMHELMNRVSLLFVYIDPIFYPVKPLIPSVIQVGGGSHIQSTKPLPKDLEHFIENATEGIIYFSLGSSVRSEHIGVNTLKKIGQVFEELPYKVIWKYDYSEYAIKPTDKLYISKWLPQPTLLKHPKVKLFITQGGCQSLDEAIYSHVPILGLPVFADQASNVKRVISKGIGLSLDYKAMTKDSFKHAILEVIHNPKYRNTVVELADLSRDQPMTGLERAVWWTEYVIRHKGAKHLRSPFIDLPNYQYYHLDVITFCLGVVFVLIYVVVKILRLSFNIVKGKFKAKQKAQ